MTAFRLPRSLVFLVLVWLAVGTLRAGDVKFPADGSGIVLTLPEGWTTTEDSDGSLKCQSPDGDLSFELFPSRNLHDPKANLPEVAQSMAEASGLTDVTTQDGGEKANPQGTMVAGVVLVGKKGDVSYAGVVSVITPTKGDFCAFQCFGVKSTLLVNARVMKSIIDSFRPAL